MDEATSFKLAKTIGDLRQNGARCILWVGAGLTKVEPHASNCLVRPLHLFRQLGGRIATACFTQEALRGLERSRWRKHLNHFQDEDEALRFLKGAKDTTPKPEIVPLIAPEADSAEESSNRPEKAAGEVEEPTRLKKKEPEEVDWTKFTFDEDKIDKDKIDKDKIDE